MTIANPAEKMITGGTTVENTAGITTVGKSQIILEITGRGLFVNGKMNGLKTVTSENQTTVQYVVSGQAKSNGF